MRKLRVLIAWHPALPANTSRHACIWSEIGQRHLSEAPAALHRAASNKSAQQLRGRQAGEHLGGCLWMCANAMGVETA